MPKKPGGDTYGEMYPNGEGFDKGKPGESGSQWSEKLPSGQRVYYSDVQDAPEYEYLAKSNKGKGSNA